MIISAIVATDLNNAIGLKNQLLWNMPADLKFFKDTTMGHPVIMGRKTYESMNRLLPGRKNLIITRNPTYQIEGAEVYTSLEEALAACRNSPAAADQVFIIGGAEIFKLAFPLCAIIYRTLVKSVFEADTFMPAIPEQQFKLLKEDCRSADEKNKFDYCFQTWQKRPDSNRL